MSTEFRPKICLYFAVEHWRNSPSVARLIEQALHKAGATADEASAVCASDFDDLIENFQCDVSSYLTDRGWEVEFVKHPQHHGVGVVYYYVVPADATFDPQIVFKAVDEALEAAQLDGLSVFTDLAKRLLAGLREAKIQAVAEHPSVVSVRLLREAVELIISIRRYGGLHPVDQWKIKQFLNKTDAALAKATGE